MSQGAVIISLGIAGGLGAAMRYGVDIWLTEKLSRRAQGYPWGIMVVNISGSLFIGILSGSLLSSATMRLIMVTGWCGGYTTFSTAMLDAVRFLRSRRYRAALATTLGTMVLAGLAASIGLWIGSSMWAI